MRIRNLTPHRLNLISPDGESDFDPDGLCPRVAMSFVQSGTIDIDGVAIPTGRTEPGEIVDLPDEEEGTLLVVSRVVAAAAPDRADLVFPDDLVRDDAGRVIGARRLSRI